MDYTTREMIEAYVQTPPVRTFLQRTFFPDSRLHVAEKIEFDVKKGKRKMAPFVAPRKGGKVIARDGFRTNQITTPKIAPERPITIDDITVRGIGENVYSQQTPEERENELLAQDYTDMEESIARRKEWMCRQVLYEGKIDVVDEEEGVDIQVDFGFSNVVVLGTSESWSVATVDPLNILRKTRIQIIKKTGVAPDMLILASDVIEDFLNNPKIIEALKTKMNNVLIEPKVIDDALTFYGRINELNMDIYTYDEWFLDDDGNEQSTIPAGTALMAHSKGEGRVEYGAVTQLEDGKHVTYSAEIVPKQYSDEKEDVKMLRLTSRPLPRPYDVDSWAVIYVNC